MTNFVTIRRHAELTGYSEDAIRSKIANKTWKEHVVWVKAPDGRILISIEGYEQWAGAEVASKRLQKAASRSRLPTLANDAVNASSSSPPPLI